MRSMALDIIEVGIARVLPARIMSEAVRYEPGRRVLLVNGSAYDVGSGRVFGQRVTSIVVRFEFTVVFSVCLVITLFAL